VQKRALGHRQQATPLDLNGPVAIFSDFSYNRCIGKNDLQQRRSFAINHRDD